MKLSNKEIALRITVASIPNIRQNTAIDNNQLFANEVLKFYQTLLNDLDKESTESTLLPLQFNK